MQVKVFGPMAGPGPTGDIVSWAPNAVVDVDDGDKTAVAFYRGFVKAGIAEVIEEPAKPSPATSPPPAKAAAKATKS